jgi:hypothetical protein
MGMYTSAMLPIMSGLARGFAVCDHWYSSAPTQTIPNRAFAAAATSQGHLDNHVKVFTSPSIFGQLSKKNIDWAIYGYNQDPLTRLQAPLVAQPLQRSEAGAREGCGLLERQVGRFQHYGFVRASAYVLGKSTASRTEYRITWFELRYVFANRFNRSGIVDTQASVFWFAQARQRAKEKRAPDREVKRIDCRGADFYQQLIVIWNRLFHLFNLEHIRAPILAMGNSFHRMTRGRPMIAIVTRYPVGHKRDQYQTGKNDGRTPL